MQLKIEAICYNRFFCFLFFFTVVLFRLSLCFHFRLKQTEKMQIEVINKSVYRIFNKFNEFYKMDVFIVHPYLIPFIFLFMENIIYDWNIVTSIPNNGKRFVDLDRTLSKC